MLRKDRDSERNKQAILKSAAKRKSFSGSKLQETATVRTYLYNEWQSKNQIVGYWYDRQ